MLQKLILKHFKCFNQFEVNFRNLTVLAGSNSVGKSSIIQAILLSRIAVEKLVQYNVYDSSGSGALKRNVEIPLNGKYLLALGNSKEVLTRDVGDNLINIELQESGEKNYLFLPFKAEDNRDDVYNIELLDSYQQVGVFDLLKDEFYYLNAERIGPRLSYDVEDLDYIHVGWQGEYTIQVISKYGEFDIEDAEQRGYPGVKDAKLINQVREWMNDIIPGFYLDYAKLEGRVKKAHTSFSNSSPTNVGFGISYVLPIVVTALIAKRGKLIIIENPEAHLHPKSQSQIGRFLAKMASSGLQIIIETHSEHVVNGLRVGSLIDGGLKPSGLLINFFKGFDSQKTPLAVEIEATEDGDLSKFPKDFFDQVNQDMGAIYNLLEPKNNG